MAKKGGEGLLGPSLIALAALLWATDGLLRYGAIRSFSTLTLVFLEHLIALGFLILPVLIRYRRSVIELPKRDWVFSALAGVGGSPGSGVEKDFHGNLS